MEQFLIAPIWQRGLPARALARLHPATPGLLSALPGGESLLIT